MSYITGISGKTSGAALVATVAHDFTGANWLGAEIVVPTGLSVTSLVDSKSNIWIPHPAGPKTFTGTASQLYCFYCENAVIDVAQTFQANFSGSDIGFLSVIGLGGRATSSSVDATNYAGDASAVTSHTGGATGGQATSLCDIVVMFGDDNGTGANLNTTYTAGSGFTLPAGLFNSDGRTATTGGIEYQAAVGTGNVISAWTSGIALTGGAFILAVKAAAAGKVPYMPYAFQPTMAM